MHPLSDLSTVQEVNDLIDEIYRNMPPEFRARVEMGHWGAAQRAEEPKLDAVCKALERRAQLLAEEGVPVFSMTGGTTEHRT